MVTLTQRNYFKPGDKVTIFGPDIDDYTFTINKLTDSDKNEIDAARHPREVVRINCDVKVHKNDLLRIYF